ncbi:MAG: hypothetical protein KIH69_003135 [Anaerolineae bacterium]|nr:hypothetical protein [Anaerolineae bacterium]
MQNNSNLNRPPEAQKAPHNGVYTIDPDQLELFPIPPQKPQNNAFLSVYVANSHQSTIRKATKIVKKHQKS